MREDSSYYIYNQIIEKTQDAIIFCDESGIIKLWNAGAEEMFGYGSLEAIGKTLDIIMSDKHRKRHWEGYQNVMRTGRSDYSKKLLAVPALRKDGVRLSVEFSIVIITDPESGNPSGVAAIIRDVTEKWEEQKKLRNCISRFRSSTRELLELINKTSGV